METLEKNQRNRNFKNQNFKNNNSRLAGHYNKPGKNLDNKNQKHKSKPQKNNKMAKKPLECFGCKSTEHRFINCPTNQKNADKQA